LKTAAGYVRFDGMETDRNTKLAQRRESTARLLDALKPVPLGTIADTGAQEGELEVLTAGFGGIYFDGGPGDFWNVTVP